MVISVTVTVNLNHAGVGEVSCVSGWQSLAVVVMASAAD